jgi:MFS family permease
MDTAKKTTVNNRLPILALLSANAISMVGNNLGIVAIPWFVLETTGSAARTGVVAFATVLPTVLSAILGGALVDRFGNIRISVIADLVSAATVACIPLLYHTVGLAFWQLALLAFLGALLDAPGNTARMAIVPELAETGNVPLERANGAFQAIQSSSVLLGPPLAGVLIAWLGAGDVLWLNSASFVVSASIVGVFVPGARRPREMSGHYLDDVRAGLAFIRGDRFLVSLLSIGAIANFAGAPLFSVVLPVFARETYGRATDLGLILGAVGAGSLLGAIAFGSVGARLPRRRMALALSFASAAPVALLALEPPIWFAIAAMAISGFGDGYVNPLIITVIYERVPEAIRGRVLGSMIACILAAAPLGMLIAGWAIEPYGIDAVVLAVSTVLLLVTALFALSPGLRDLGPDPETRSIDESRAVAVASD